MAGTSSIAADKTISVQDFIALQSSDEITYAKYSITEYINGYEMFITNLLYDYEDEINAISLTIKFTDIEKAKYRFKPYLLAFDIYGATEAKFIIMMLNNIIDPKEFDFDKVKVVRKGDLIDILNRIQAVNEDYLSTNRSKLKDDLKKGKGNNIWIE